MKDFNELNQNQVWHYDLVAKFLHWIIALLLIGLITLGWYMVSIEDSPGSSWYFDLHKSFGLVTAILILLRLIWRFSHRPAPLPSSVPTWQAKMASTLHWLLYISIIIMPITGFLGASFSKHGVAFFGLQLPEWVNKNHNIAEQFFEIHEIMAWVLVVLIILHILASLKHLVIDKDKVFKRMWF